ncbi:DUF805 domain-containing protein [Robiginitomaculum antarcticum]|uniref:hypothetical protein n=1 Tax=Robiginitomaculum antarcticum TaxID=437507 RepID=UPI0003A8657A|nr:hypothetical protein [Robiginitomaculum antarcticum]
MRRRQSEYWLWAVIFIILLFGFDLIFGRILNIYLHTQSACSEMAAGLLTDFNGISLQDWGYSFAISLFMLWAGIGIIYVDILKTGKFFWRMSAHMIGFFAIFCFISAMKLLSPGGGAAPDGSLNVADYAAISDDISGQITRYENMEAARHPAATYVWKLRGDVTQNDIEYYNGASQCVWRTEKIVTTATGPITQAEFQVIATDRAPHDIALQRDQYPGAKSMLWTWIWTERLGYSRLQSSQHYRPMTPEELIRFDEKQRCIENAHKTAQSIGTCDWVRLHLNSDPP